MRDLNYQLKQLRDRNRDGSYATQPDLARISRAAARHRRGGAGRDYCAAGPAVAGGRGRHSPEPDRLVHA